LTYSECASAVLCELCNPNHASPIVSSANTLRICHPAPTLCRKELAPHGTSARAAKRPRGHKLNERGRQTSAVVVNEFQRCARESPLVRVCVRRARGQCVRLARRQRGQSVQCKLHVGIGDKVEQRHVEVFRVCMPIESRRCVALCCIVLRCVVL